MTRQAVALRSFSIIAIVIGFVILLCAFVLPILVIPAIVIIALGILMCVKASDEGFWKMKERSAYLKPLLYQPCGVMVLDHAPFLNITMGDSAFLIGRPFEQGTTRCDMTYLPKDKVTRIELKSDSTVETRVENRPGMTFLGAVLFDWIGAILGGLMTKEKTTVTTRNFLVFTVETQDSGSVEWVFEYDGAKAKSGKYQDPKIFVDDYNTNNMKYAHVA